MSNAHFIFADYYEMAIYHVTTTRINFASSKFGRDIQGVYKMSNDCYLIGCYNCEKSTL